LAFEIGNFQISRKLYSPGVNQEKVIKRSNC
jgi:hypothetical protein